MQYQKQKEEVSKLLNVELVYLINGWSRIDYELFFKITTDMTRIENILKDLNRYDYEFEEYCVLVKEKVQLESK